MNLAAIRRRWHRPDPNASAFMGIGRSWMRLESRNTVNPMLRRGHRSLLREDIPRKHGTLLLSTEHAVRVVKKDVLSEIRCELFVAWYY